MITTIHCYDNLPPILHHRCLLFHGRHTEWTKSGCGHVSIKSFKIFVSHQWIKIKDEIYVVKTSDISFVVRHNRIYILCNSITPFHTNRYIEYCTLILYCCLFNLLCTCRYKQHKYCYLKINSSTLLLMTKSSVRPWTRVTDLTLYIYIYIWYLFIF